MPELPITLLARRQVCGNAVFTVYFDHIRDAAGREVVDYLSVVPHHHAAGKISGVAVLPIFQGTIGLVRIYRHPLGDFRWELARGFIDAGEAPAAAALRELREEMGLSAREASLRPLGTVAPEPGVLDARVQLFLAEDCTMAKEVSEGDIGHRGVRFFPRAELARLIDDGEIIDPCTLVAGLKYLASP